VHRSSKAREDGCDVRGGGAELVGGGEDSKAAPIGGATMATEGLPQGLKLADPPEVVCVLLVGVEGVPKRL